LNQVEHAQFMPPFWPFKKKDTVAEVDEGPPAPMVYKRGEDPHARPLVTSDTEAYKDALALFGDGSQTVEAATDQSVHYDGVTASDEPVSSLEDEPASVVSPSADGGDVPSDETVTWVHHTDGYHYKRHADGSFEPTPYTLGENGSYQPYS